MAGTAAVAVDRAKARQQVETKLGIQLSAAKSNSIEDTRDVWEVLAVLAERCTKSPAAKPKPKPKSKKGTTA